MGIVHFPTNADMHLNISNISVHQNFGISRRNYKKKNAQGTMSSKIE